MFCLKIILESTEIYKNHVEYVKKIVIGTYSLSQCLRVAGVTVTFSTSTLPKTFTNNFFNGKWKLNLQGRS